MDARGFALFEVKDVFDDEVRCKGDAAFVAEATFVSFSPACA